MQHLFPGIEQSNYYILKIDLPVDMIEVCSFHPDISGFDP